MKTRATSSDIQDSGGVRVTEAALIGLAVLVAGAGLVSGVAFGASFNNVQVFVTTSASLPYSYVFTAYNITGALVGTYQSSYPAAAFELPNGDYLFTVSAIHQFGGACYMCVESVSGTKYANGSSYSSPVRYFQPASEYGFLIQRIDSSQTLHISTQNVTQLPTAKVSVKVAYVNGNAAAGASVSASIVGQWYSWWGQGTNVVMWAQTGTDGVASLVLPVAPAVVTAWSWVPVNLPANETTIVRDVGGEKVNVTVYWQPTYVGLSASALLLPPATSVSLTLRYQQPNYWVLPMGVQSGVGQVGPSGSATIANEPTGVPLQTSAGASRQGGSSNYYTPPSIPPLSYQPGGGTNQTGQTFLGLNATNLVLSAGIIAVAAVGILWIVFRRRTHRLSAT